MRILGFGDAASAVSEDVEASAPVEPDPQVREVAITLAVRAALAWLDQVDLVEVFKPRASVMKSVPKFLCGAFRIALRTALQEAVLGGDVGDEVNKHVAGSCSFCCLGCFSRPPHMEGRSGKTSW